MEIEEEQPEEEEEEEERGGENKSVRKYVTVEIKSDIPALFDDSRDDDFEKKRKNQNRRKENGERLES